MAGFQPVRGTHDLYGAPCRRHRYVESVAGKTAQRYGFEEIQTPVFEFTGVFARSLGETSDVVTKEMYTFPDRGGESLTLRPEGTAAVVRAFISNGLMQKVPLKVFYQGPMFRYERPQKGRQRQFHQVGVEVLGADSAQADVETVALGANFLRALGLKDKVTLHLNTLGDFDSRQAYHRELVDYLQTYRDRLSADSLKRLDTNPLRILDSKDKQDRDIVESAPRLADSLTAEAQEFFAEVREGLEACGVSYVVDPHLVRGLDYYTHTAFEFVTESLGAQGTVLGGGRYDGLVKQLGGHETPGIGWAAGVERLASLMSGDVDPPRPIAVIPAGRELEKDAMATAMELREKGYAVHMAYSGSMGKRMKKANRANARAAVIFGPEEHARNAVSVRDFETGDQEEIPLDLLEENLVRFRED